MSVPITEKTGREGCRHPAAELECFRNFTIAHPRLAAVKDRLTGAISEAAPGSLILVVGPAGVGKTTLLLKVQQLLAAEMFPTLESDPGRLPFVSVEAVASVTGNFSWRDYFTRVLRRMDEPLVESKFRLDQFHGERDWKGRLTSAARAAGLELQYAVEQALRHRRPAAVFIDEAQHLARIASGRKLSDQLDVIKSIANRTETVHVLAGTYELLAFCNLSGQLSRRSLHIHFARYFAESREDVQIFKNVVHTFQKALPTRADSDLVSDWEFLYEGSVGCVGILKDWLMRASIAARKGAHHVLTRKILEDTALSASQCEKILMEAREGEARLTEGPESRSRLRVLLGLTAGSVETFPTCKAQPRKQLRRQRRPGERLPKRDPVGGAATTSVPRDDLRAMGA